MTENILTYMTFVPLAGMALVLMLPRDRHELIRWTALLATLPPLVMGVWLFTNFDRSTDAMQFMVRHDWISSFNIQYIMGIDGISVTMLLLTALLCPICILASWKIDKGVKGYFALFLLLDVGMTGVFCALDFFLFYIFLTIIISITRTPLKIFISKSLILHQEWSP